MILSSRERTIKIPLCVLNTSDSTLNEGGWNGDFEGKKLERGSSWEDTFEISSGSPTAFHIWVLTKGRYIFPAEIYKKKPKNKNDVFTQLQGQGLEVCDILYSSTSWGDTSQGIPWCDQNHSANKG